MLLSRGGKQPLTRDIEPGDVVCRPDLRMRGDFAYLNGARFRSAEGLQMQNSDSHPGYVVEACALTR